MFDSNRATFRDITEEEISIIDEILEKCHIYEYMILDKRIEEFSGRPKRKNIPKNTLVYVVKFKITIDASNAVTIRASYEQINKLDDTINDTLSKYNIRCDALASDDVTDTEYSVWVKEREYKYTFYYADEQ